MTLLRGSASRSPVLNTDDNAPNIDDRLIPASAIAGDGKTTLEGAGCAAAVPLSRFVWVSLECLKDSAIRIEIG